MVTIEQVKAKLKERGKSGYFSRGAHQPNGEFCLMEFGSQLHGEKWSDEPQAYDPAWSAFCRMINDAAWPDNKTRTKECLPLLLHGLRGTLPKDWVARVALRTIREIVPLAFEAAAKIHPDKSHRAALRKAKKAMAEASDLSEAESAAESAAAARSARLAAAESAAAARLAAARSARLAAEAARLAWLAAAESAAESARSAWLAAESAAASRVKVYRKIIAIAIEEAA
jgi:hypothetical protein